jgi:hypothetical protein
MVAALIEANADKFIAATKGHATKLVAPEKGTRLRHEATEFACNSRRQSLQQR